MNQENGKTGTESKPVEMYRVRRICDGWYLTGNNCCAHSNTVSLRWYPEQVNPGNWTHDEAAKIADAMMVLCEDSGIEIEPV